MTADFFHILASSLWIGVAVSLPFWGNRMKRADNLPMVLGIADTVFVLKNIFIMGGLVLTGLTGSYLTVRQGLPFFDFNERFLWLALAQTLFVLIALNSCTILVFMILGRRGRRRFYRYVPPLGYNNIALIILVYLQMVVRPTTTGQQVFALLVPLVFILLANSIFILQRTRIAKTLKGMSSTEFAQHYFHLLNTENMYELLRLFDDDAMVIDSFATKPVKGVVAIEKFFQFLGDQFDTIRIEPEAVSGDKDQPMIEWNAEGVTQNGLKMESLRGTNRMSRDGARITKMVIDFDVKDLPQLQLYTPPG